MLIALPLAFFATLLAFIIRLLNNRYSPSKGDDNQGYKLGISSGTIESIILEYLKKFKISPLVNVIMGWKEGFEKGKDHFEYLKKKSFAEESEILFLGDSLNDAIRAKNNNIHINR